MSCEQRPCQSSPSFFQFRACKANAIVQLLSPVGEPDAAPAPQRRAVLVGFQPDRADAVGGKLLVALLGIAGDADRADDLARVIANLQPAALGKNLLAARGDDRERPAVELGATRQDRLDEAVGLRKRDGGHGPSGAGVDGSAFNNTPL